MNDAVPIPQPVAAFTPLPHIDGCQDHCRRWLKDRIEPQESLKNTDDNFIEYARQVAVSLGKDPKHPFMFENQHACWKLWNKQIFWRMDGDVFHQKCYIECGHIKHIGLFSENGGTPLCMEYGYEVTAAIKVEQVIKHIREIYACYDLSDIPILCVESDRNYCKRPWGIDLNGLDMPTVFAIIDFIRNKDNTKNGSAFEALCKRVDTARQQMLGMKDTSPPADFKAAGYQLNLSRAEEGMACLRKMGYEPEVPAGEPADLDKDAEIRRLQEELAASHKREAQKDILLQMVQDENKDLLQVIEVQKKQIKRRDTAVRALQSPSYPSVRMEEFPADLGPVKGA